MYISEFLRIFSFIFFSFSACAEYFANPPSKVAVINLQHILDNAKAMQQIKQQVNQKMRVLEQESVIKEAELKKFEFAVQNNQSSINALNAKISEIQRSIENKKKLIEEFHSKSIDTLLSDIQKITKSICKSKGYTIAIHKNNLIYFDSEYDITQEVLKKLNHEF